MTEPTSLPDRLRDFIDTYRGMDDLGYTGLMTQAVAEIEQLRARMAAGTEWRGLTGEERAAFVNEICEYGTGFVSPLFALAESLEKVLKTRNAPAARPSGHCAEGERCVCGGDLPRIRQGCANWRKA